MGELSRGGLSGVRRWTGLWMGLWMGLCVGLSGCGEDAQDAKDTAKEAQEKVKAEALKRRDALAAKIEAQVKDYLTCAGLARPNTLEAVSAVLKDREALELDKLLMAPDHVGQIVALAGVSVEGYLLLGRNVALLASSGLGAELVERGPDALECDRAVPVACTTGMASSTPLCSPAGKVSGVRSEYAACMLRGDRHDGALTLRAGAADSTSINVKFDGFTINQLDELHGDVTLDVDLSAKRQSVALSAQESLELRAFGGHEGELSCGQTTRLTRLDVTRDERDGLRVALQAQKLGKEERYGLTTFGQDLSWSPQPACTCPRTGSGLELTFARPLGRQDVVATLRVSFEGGQQGACPTARATLPDWPTTCSLLESPFKDCGRAAAEAVLTPLLSSLCQPVR